MKDYTQYFVTKFREEGTGFTCLGEDTPDELHNLVQDVHLAFDALPNDWIYNMIKDAFQDLANNSLDDCSIEADCYHHRLYAWFGEPYANELCAEVLQDGLVSEPKNIYDVIGYAQWLAMTRIYEMVNEFMEEQERGEDE